MRGERIEWLTSGHHMLLNDTEILPLRQDAPLHLQDRFPIRLGKRGHFKTGVPAGGWKLVVL